MNETILGQLATSCYVGGGAFVYMSGDMFVRDNNRVLSRASLLASPEVGRYFLEEMRSSVRCQCPMPAAVCRLGIEV